MAYTQEDLRTMAKLSLEGEFERHTIDQFCKNYPDLTEEEGYGAQTERMRMAEEMGYHVVGYKLGGTSLAKAAPVANPAEAPFSVTYGRLFDYMRVNGTLDWNKRLHPKIEGEFCFIMGQDLSGADVTPADVLKATEKVVPSFEIVENRFHDAKVGWKYDALADNTASAAFMAAEAGVDPNKVDLNTVTMSMYINGECIGTGTGETIVGSPARAVAAFVRELNKAGYGLKKGDLVLSGAVTGATPIKLGDQIKADFGIMGSVELTVI